MTASKIHLVCNAHLDPVWLWEWPEGAAEALSTFRAAAGLCREFPGFIFNHNEAILYHWVREFEPRLFDLIAGLVREGRWHVMGGWYLQPDCNLPAGESFVRQILLGRRFFREMFGVAPRTAVNRDPFGHSRGLVQVLARSGYDSYLFCRPGPAELDLPDECFIWVGFDGSEVLAQRATAHYNSRGGEARAKVEAWVKADPGRGVSLLLWGVGNHGGGPSRRDLEDLEAYNRDHPEAVAFHSTPEAYFLEAASPGAGRPRWDRGLNPWAVGCYTSMARVKKNHRKLENELFAAEKMAAAAFCRSLMPYPSAELAEAQADLALSQFHDILPGSSVPEAEDGALRLLGHGLEIASRVKTRAFFALAAGEPPAGDGEIPILVYNPHPYPVTGPLEVELQPAEPNELGGFLAARVRTRAGREAPCQVEKEASTLSLDWRKKVVFRAELEPGVMNRFACRLEREPDRPGPKPPPRGRSIRIRTAWGEVAIGVGNGLVESLRFGGDEFLGRQSFQPVVRAANADPWGMGLRGFRQTAGRFRLMTGRTAAWLTAAGDETVAPVRVVEDGPVRTVVESLFVHGHSYICQRYKICRTDPEVELETRVLWNEKDRMLKLRVPTSWPDSVCLGQVVFGREELAANGDESVSQKWQAVVSRGRGLALTVINDRTYGSDFLNGELRLSLLRSAAYAADPGSLERLRSGDRFIPRQDQGEHVFRFWIRGGPAEERLAAVDREALARNEVPMALSFFPPGTGRKCRAAAVLEGEAVQMTALKKAEDGDDLVIRLFEPTGRPRTAILSLPWAEARTEVRLEAFEIKTLRYEARSGRFRETNLLEETGPGQSGGKAGGGSA
jgi:alpha-mannosidase